GRQRRAVEPLVRTGRPAAAGTLRGHARRYRGAPSRRRGRRGRGAGTDDPRAPAAGGWAAGAALAQADAHRQWPLAGVSRARAQAPRVHAVARVAAGTGRRVRPGGRIRHRMIRRAPDVAGCVHLSSAEIPMRRLSASPFRASLLILALATAGAVPALAVDTPPAAAEPATDAALQAVLAGDWRSADNRARDQYRHPAQTLAFFGLAPDQTVVEITPGGGWYAEILAPYLRGQGQYVAAIVDPAAVPEGRGRDYQQRSKDGVEKRFAEAPERFDAARIIGYDPAAPKFGEAGSA